MRQRSIGIIILICMISVPVFTTGSELVPRPEGVDMIVWEHQNWESNGGFERLTTWSDGRSEVLVVPLQHTHDGMENLRPKNGWEKVMQKSPPHVEFVRTNIYRPDVGRTKFKEALEAGIHLLESFKPGYRDGSGIRVVIRIKSQNKGIVIPMFMDREKGTLNHKRFLAVSEILGGFDRSAYEIISK